MDGRDEWAGLDCEGAVYLRERENRFVVNCKDIVGLFCEMEVLL